MTKLDKHMKNTVKFKSNAEAASGLGEGAHEKHCVVCLVLGHF